MNATIFNALSSFTDSIQKAQDEKLIKQQEILRNISSGGKYYGGFILATDPLFKESISHYEWDCVSEWHDCARVVIPLPPPKFGCIILYRLRPDKFCAKVLAGFTYEVTFPTWDKLKNFCFSRGLFQPPAGTREVSPMISQDAFSARLDGMDEVMMLDKIDDSIVKGSEDNFSVYEPGEDEPGSV